MEGLQDSMMAMRQYIENDAFHLHPSLNPPTVLLSWGLRLGGPRCTSRSFDNGNYDGTLLTGLSELS